MKQITTYWWIFCASALAWIGNPEEGIIMAIGAVALAINNIKE